MTRPLPLALLLCLVAAPLAAQQKKAEKKAPPVPSVPPTAANVAYGTHERQVLDFWQAKSEQPTPLVLYIHGGGWRGGDKGSVGGLLKPCLDAGISVAAINYRYVQNGVEQKVQPPVKAPLEDAARALQFIRSKAKEWNLDKKRVGATGGSAGACSSLWLAFHDDMADPNSSDPVARESTRLACAAVNGAQVTLDPKPLREWMPNYQYGAHAFGLAKLDDVLADREKLLPWIKEYSPMEHVTRDDPPVMLAYGGEAPQVGGTPKDPTHSATMGLKLAEKCRAAGAEVVFTYPGQSDPKYKSTTEFLVDHLKK